MCQGFSYFSVFSHCYVLAKLATSSIRVKDVISLPYGSLISCHPRHLLPEGLFLSSRGGIEGDIQFGGGDPVSTECQKCFTHK